MISCVGTMRPMFAFNSARILSFAPMQPPGDQPSICLDDSNIARLERMLRKRDWMVDWVNGLQVQNVATDHPSFLSCLICRTSRRRLVASLRFQNGRFDEGNWALGHFGWPCQKQP